MTGPGDPIEPSDHIEQSDAVDTGIEPWLREILRCPQCRSELADAQGETGPELHCTNPACGLQYRIDDGVPVLLVDEARKPA
jgi:uncharacterized protein YbaR (Trm112 family)